jgi:hypothetical protein
MTSRSWRRFGVMAAPRGAPPRSKVSTMIMWPPQQGHGERWSAVTLAAGSVSSCAAGGSITGTGPAISFSGACNIGYWLASGAGKQPVVANAVEPSGRGTWSKKRLMNSSGASVSMRTRKPTLPTC